MAVYKLFWDEFSSWYLEMIKPAYGQPINKKVYDTTIGFFDNLLHLLHPVHAVHHRRVVAAHRRP